MIWLMLGILFNSIAILVVLAVDYLRDAARILELETLEDRVKFLETRRLLDQDFPPTKG